MGVENTCTFPARIEHSFQGIGDNYKITPLPFDLTKKLEILTCQEKKLRAHKDN